MSPKHQDPLHINVAVEVLPETRQERRARLAKAKTACEQAQQRVEDKTKRLDDNATTPNKRALTCAKNALAKAQARLKAARVAKVMTRLCYATNRVGNWSLKRIYSTYRGRFGIESSYRQSRQARIFTSSRKPWFRLLIFGLSMMLRNLWLEVRWHLGETPNGGAVVARFPKRCFRFRCFCGGLPGRPGRPFASRPGCTLKLSCRICELQKKLRLPQRKINGLQGMLTKRRCDSLQEKMQLSWILQKLMRID